MSPAGAESVDGLPASEKGRVESNRDGAVNTVAVSGKYDELPPISAISLAEDFTPFMQSTVPQALKRQALKALFKEPHFNVMDGLDIYIDDYTVFEPISPEVMATLSSWKTIMNPPQQVVTPDGYAVDVESEEGRAVLAARAELAQADTALQSREGGAEVPPLALPERAEGEGDDQAQPTSTTSDSSSSDESLKVIDAAPAAALTPVLSRAAGEGAAQHARYGKRVGDFSASAHVAADQAALDAANSNPNPNADPDPTACTVTKNITQ